MRRYIATAATLALVGLLLGSPNLAPRGVAADLTRETPSSADAFTDSWGADTHFAYRDGTYRSHQGKEIAALEASGIRHIRDGLPMLPPDAQAILDDLCQHGIKHSIGFGVHTTGEKIIAAIKKHKPECLDEVEPQNEYDGAHDSDWVATITDEQKLLYTTVKSQPSFSSITVLGPPLVNLRHYAELGNIEAYSDAGNLHFSTCDGNPKTRRYKSLDVGAQFARSSWPAKPIWTTETAYTDDVARSKCAVDESIAGSLVLRTQLEQWAIHAPRTYWYAFSDEPSDHMFGVQGFVDANGDAKPRYNMLKAVTHLLADPGRVFAIKPVRINIGSDVAVDHQLFQKRDGTTYLFIWQEVESWDRDQQHRRSVPSAAVTVSVPASAKEITRYDFDAKYNLQKKQLSAPDGRLRLNVSDAPSIVSFRD